MTKHAHESSEHLPQHYCGTPHTNKERERIDTEHAEAMETIGKRLLAGERGAAPQHIPDRVYLAGQALNALLRDPGREDLIARRLDPKGELPEDLLVKQIARVVGDMAVQFADGTLWALEAETCQD